MFGLGGQRQWFERFADSGEMFPLRRQPLCPILAAIPQELLATPEQAHPITYSPLGPALLSRLALAQTPTQFYLQVVGQVDGAYHPTDLGLGGQANDPSSQS